jgi:catechol 2,3-dioxygenase-like lactoylglutathione lyase family enzyme
MFTIDHLAFPCFDVAGTTRFYTEVLGGRLRHTQSGPAPAWNAREYHLMVFELPGGIVVDFFWFEGIRRPDEGLPKDIRHVALSVTSRDEVMLWKHRLEAAGESSWVETHSADDLHVYVTDPNGLTWEIVAVEDGSRSR